MAALLSFSIYSSKDHYK